MPYSSGGQRTITPLQPGEHVPLRQVPDSAEDAIELELDAKRIQLVVGDYCALDDAHAGFERTVEGHIRFLSGRHWDAWSDIQGRYVDAREFMTATERRWRQRPVMDYLTYWFVLTLAKVTENPPVIGFLPANADRESQMLAEVMEPVSKWIAQEAELDVTNMRALAWVLAAGEAYIASFVDPERGDETPQIGPALLALTRPDGSTIERPVEGVPYDGDGNPLAQLTEDGSGYDVTGEPYMLREGMIDTAALCPLEIRSEWGHNIPWNRRRWITHRWFKPADELEKLFGVRVEPDSYPEGDQGPGYLERMLYGTGYFGQSRGDAMLGLVDKSMARSGYVCGYTRWERPDGARLPKGRLTICTHDRVLWDAERPYDCEAAGPIRRLGWIGIPGRPFDTTPLERMLPLQKRLNRLEAQIAEYIDKCSKPLLFYASNTGIDGDDFETTPGQNIEYEPVPGQGQPAHWLAPPPLPSDVWRHKNDIRQQMFVIGGMAGSDGAPPTADPSGDLIQELRFNADRTISPLIHSLVNANADVAQDWIAMLPAIWTEEKVIALAGQDNVVRTVTVLPEIWSGDVHVKPVIESAAPETRAERQRRVEHLYQLGAFGAPGDPGSVAKLLELSRFPDLGRASRPGGVHRIMAERNVGRLARGDQSEAIPLLEVYDLDTHLGVTTEHMASPEYLDYTSEVQQQFMVHLQRLRGASVAKMLTQGKQAAAMAGIESALSGAVQHAAQMSAPRPPAGPGASTDERAAAGEAPHTDTNKRAAAGNPDAGPQGAAA